MSRALTDDEAITMAMLLGAEFDYDDYGHPERATARMYWKARLPLDPRVHYGSTKADAARALLWFTGKKLWSELWVPSVS